MLTIHVWPKRLKEFLLTYPLYKSPKFFWVHRAIYAENGKLPASAQCADILVYVFALSRGHEHGLAGGESP